MLLISSIFICIILAFIVKSYSSKNILILFIYFISNTEIFLSLLYLYLSLFVEYIFPYLFFLLVLPIVWDCLCFLFVSVLLKPFMPYFEFLHPYFLCIGALLTPFPTFMETLFSKSLLLIEVLVNLPSTATNEQVLSLFTSEFANLLPYFLHFHLLCTTLIPSLFLADFFSDSIPPLDENAQFTSYNWSFCHFPARSTTYAYLFMYFFHLCDPVGHKQLNIAYIAYHSLFKEEPSFIRGNYTQYLLEAPSHILTSSYYSLPNFYNNHWK